MSDGQPMNAPVVVTRRPLELIGAFVVVPVLLTLGPRWLVTVVILASGVVCALALVLDPTFPRRQLIDAAAVRSGLKAVLLRTAAVWAGLLALTLAASPRTLFIFPRTRPTFWLILMILYPLSAYAQEIVFRTFFFHRYGALFARPRARVLASGLIFGWAHVVVNNLWAVPLAAIAGLLFAHTYERSRSTLLVSIEHALYGNFVFSVGLGALFYSTSRWLAR
jgi:membrane protease YdiL (CAAX protease family)